MDPIKDKLEAAGFTNVVAIRKGRWYTVTKGGEGAAVLFQHDSAWHWFSVTQKATASGSSAESCDRGGLGDAIGDDNDMKQYKRMVLQVPRGLMDFEGVYAAVQQVQAD